MPRLKMVFMDVDGVLVPERSSWDYVHRALGVQERAREAFRDFVEGRIDYAEWMRRDTQLWVEAAGGRLHRSDLERILSGIPLTEGARELVSWLHRAGVSVILVSAGVEVLVARVAREVGADGWVAPRLWFDKRGYLIPGGSPLVAPTGPRGKGVIVRRLAMMHGVDLGEAAYVGDSRWDRGAFTVVGHPIAYGPYCEEIQDVVECRVMSMEGLRRALSEIISAGRCSSRTY